MSFLNTEPLPRAKRPTKKQVKLPDISITQQSKKTDSKTQRDITRTIQPMVYGCLEAVVGAVAYVHEDLDLHTRRRFFAKKRRMSRTAIFVREDSFIKTKGTAVVPRQTVESVIRRSSYIRELKEDLRNINVWDRMRTLQTSLIMYENDSDEEEWMSRPSTRDKSTTTHPSRPRSHHRRRMRSERQKLLKRVRNDPLLVVICTLEPDLDTHPYYCLAHVQPKAMLDVAAHRKTRRPPPFLVRSSAGAKEFSKTLRKKVVNGDKSGRAAQPRRNVKRKSRNPLVMNLQF